MRARRDSALGVNVDAHSPHKNQGGAGHNAENNQLCTERPIRLPWRDNENRSYERDRKEHERPRRNDVKRRVVSRYSWR